MIRCCSSDGSIFLISRKISKADEIKKDDEDRKNYVDQFREKLSEMQKEQAQNAKF